VLDVFDILCEPVDDGADVDGALEVHLYGATQIRL